MREEGEGGREGGRGGRRVWEESGGGGGGGGEWHVKASAHLCAMDTNDHIHHTYVPLSIWKLFRITLPRLALMLRSPNRLFQLTAGMVTLEIVLST